MSGNLFRMNDYLVFLYMANMPKIKKINIANIPLYEEEEEEKYGTMHRGSNLEAQKSTFFPTRTLQNKETQRKTTKYNITLHLSDSLETVDSHGIHTDFGLPPGFKVYIKARGLKRVNMGDMDMDICVFKDPVECINSSFKIFDMSGWKCSGLNPTFLSKSKCFLNLVTLNARNSDLGKGLISDKDVRFLRGLRHLKKVDLSRNDLSRLHDNFFHDQRKSLQKVNLTNNNFDRIPPAIWKLQN
ncbi:hypothetical protein FSP39_001364 [Pinctada imbricata]|uniref:Uncharacterized protein n=1 Tax=Pinctada imbricata TaxID=66713 RepID=A0AA88YLD8_PINIB|nr:hypothetical protein FSP39_001364 [Pinctada imbricata]